MPDFIFRLPLRLTDAQRLAIEIKTSIQQYTKQIIEKGLRAKKDTDKMRQDLIQRKKVKKGKSL